MPASVPARWLMTTFTFFDAVTCVGVTFVAGPTGFSLSCFEHCPQRCNVFFSFPVTAVNSIVASRSLQMSQIMVSIKFQHASVDVSGAVEAGRQVTVVRHNEKGLSFDAGQFAQQIVQTAAGLVVQVA